MVLALSFGMAPSLHLLPLFWLLAFVGAQSPAGPDTVKNFCGRWWSQSTIKNDTLYIDSGVQKFPKNTFGGNATALGINSYLVTVPLSYNWDWTKSGGDQQLNITTEPKNYTNTQAGHAIPRKFRGYMFAGPQNTSNVYSFGGSNYMYNQSFIGKTSPGTSNYALWSYTPGSGGPETKWNTFESALSWIPNHGAGADAPDLGLGFYLHGQIDSGSIDKTTTSLKDNSQEAYTPLNGMLVIDLVQPQIAPKNISTQTLNQTLPRVGGSLDYISSVGDNGILVALGGQIQENVEEQVVRANSSKLIDFRFVDIFDIDSYLKNRESNGMWYHQETTGDVPPPRIDYCTVTASAPDNSSHHIYLHGGRDPSKNYTYDDIAVLSIPSFRWSTEYTDHRKGRWGHNCHLYRNQIITVGGNLTNSTCDWETKGVAIYNTTASIWSNYFTSNSSSFTVPQTLLPSTNGTPAGQATVKEPVTGWSSDGLQAVFQKNKWTATNPPLNTTGAHSDDPKTGEDNTAAIAGGISGGVVGVAIILAGLIYWHHRRQQALMKPSDDQVLLAHRSSETAEVPDFVRNEIHGNPRTEVDGRHVSPRVEIDTNYYFELSSTALAPGATAGMPVLRLPDDHVAARRAHPGGLRRAHMPRENRRSLSVSSAEERSRRRSSRSRRSSESRESWTFRRHPT